MPSKSSFGDSLMPPKGQQKATIQRPTLQLKEKQNWILNDDLSEAVSDSSKEEKPEQESE